MENKQYYLCCNIISMCILPCLGFDFGQRMIFTDPGNNNNNPFFHYLNFESENSSAIYIGALLVCHNIFFHFIDSNAYIQY